MADPKKWINVQVAIQTALGASKTIGTISKASPGVVSSDAHGLSDGAYVLLDDIEGMFQLDGRAFRIDAAVASPPDAGVFSLPGEDTSLYGTFTSGVAKEITFGVNMRTAVGLTGAGGEFDFLDYTTIHDVIRKQTPGLPSAISYTFENIWDLEDPALIALRAASTNQQERAVRFRFAGGEEVVFSGFIGCTLLPIGNALEIVKTSCVVTMNGVPSMYAAP